MKRYGTCMQLGLTDAEKSDLVQSLLSLTFGSEDSQQRPSTSSSK